jgi:hypothetical protein
MATIQYQLMYFFDYWETDFYRNEVSLLCGRKTVGVLIGRLAG